MTNYAPLFDGIVESSLWEEPDIVVKIFLTMLAKKDRNHTVTGDPYRIAKWAHKDELETVEALKVLASPDTRRKLPQEYDGRRIEMVDGRWLILNGDKYQKEMVRMNRRVYQRNWKREKAAEKAAAVSKTPVTPEEFPMCQNGKLTVEEENQFEPKDKTPIQPPTPPPPAAWMHQPKRTPPSQ